MVLWRTLILWGAFALAEDQTSQKEYQAEDRNTRADDLKCLVQLILRCSIAGEYPVNRSPERHELAHAIRRIVEHDGTADQEQ